MKDTVLVAVTKNKVVKAQTVHITVDYYKVVHQVQNQAQVVEVTTAVVQVQDQVEFMVEVAVVHLIMDIHKLHQAQQKAVQKLKAVV